MHHLTSSRVALRRVGHKPTSHFGVFVDLGGLASSPMVLPIRRPERKSGRSSSAMTLGNTGSFPTRASNILFTGIADIVIATMNEMVARVKERNSTFIFERFLMIKNIHENI